MALNSILVWSPTIGDLQLTPSLLAQLLNTDSPTNVTTTVGTTLTATAISSGLINRTGPTATFTDTTDTAVNMATQNPPGNTFYVDFKNATAFQQTLQGGTGVTFSSSNIIPANSVAEFLVSISADGKSSVFNHIFSVPLTNMNPEAIVALATVGAGTITGASIATQAVTRSGAQSGAAFTDTTDTAANIIAAQPNVHVGSSWEWTYTNNTNAVATLQGGAGVTISGGTIVLPNGGYARYLVTYTVAATITMQLLLADGDPPPAQFTTAALTVGAVPAGAITGAAFVIWRNTGATPGAQTVRTAAQMLADFPGAYVGMSYMLRIVNTGSGTLTLTADGGATVTIPTHAAVLTNTFVDYVVTFNTATTATIQSVGAGTSP